MAASSHHHNSAMRARLHEGPHCCLVTLYGPGPESPIGIAKDVQKCNGFGPRDLALAGDSHIVVMELLQARTRAGYGRITTPAVRPG